MRKFSVMSVLLIFCCCQALSFGASWTPQYSAPITLVSGTGNAYSLASGDLDRDGDMDFALAIWDQGLCSWFESNGAASPQYTRHDLVSATSPHEIKIADINGDGWLDIVAICSSKIYWFRNLKTTPATFEMNTLESATSGGWALDIVDLDGDGDQDIVAATYGTNRVTWYRNNGDGPQTTFAKVTISTHPVPVYVRGVDLDRDGFKDVIVSFSSDKRLSWFKNNNNASFTEHIISTEGWSIEIGDLDSDGWTDFVAIGGGTNTVSWYRNLGSQGTVAFAAHSLTNIAGPQSILVCDYNYDQRPDILFAAQTTHSVIWYENANGLGSFSPRTLAFSPKYTWNAYYFDYDNDGDLDIVCLTSGSVFTLKNLSGLPVVVNAVRDWATYE